MQRDLFGQLFSLSLEQTLNIDKVLAYPLTPVPLALCHTDGTICKTDKSVLLKVLQKEIDSNPPERCDVINYDGFFYFALNTRRAIIVWKYNSEADASIYCE